MGFLCSDGMNEQKPEMWREKKTTIIQVELSGECFTFVPLLEMAWSNGAGVALPWAKEQWRVISKSWNRESGVLGYASQLGATAASAAQQATRHMTYPKPISNMYSIALWPWYCWYWWWSSKKTVQLEIIPVTSYHYHHQPDSEFPLTFSSLASMLITNLQSTEGHAGSMTQDTYWHE